MKANANNGKVIKMVQTLLESERIATEITPAFIAEKIKLILPLNPAWKDVDEEYLLDELIRRNSISSGTFHKLGDNKNHIQWYSKEEKVDRLYWERYRSYLEESLPWAAIEGINEITDSVMSDIESPRREGVWDRRGLVVGHVQSGKTSNYTGLICKAADAGYKIIIVLAGLHNNLRAQTQARLDEGFLGYETNPDSQHPDLGSMRRIGVGDINKDPKLRPQWVTTRLETGDFKAHIAQNLGVTPEERPWLFVVKKQKNILTGLLKWLKEHVSDSVDSETGEKSIGRLPLLMIDDEADNASVDTGEQVWDDEDKPDLLHSPKAINSLVRQILKVFQKKAYVGYTATPFANIFIHEKGETLKEGPDLFPSSFIYNIPAPSNYIGPGKVFGTAGEDLRENALPLTVAVDDHTDDEKQGWVPPKHNKYHIPTYPNETNLPPSLINAIDSFLLACAARNARGMSDKHNSMLIHVTRFQNVQNELKESVASYIKYLRQRVSRQIDHESFKSRLQNTWQNDFVPKTETINKLKLFDQLPINSWAAIWKEVQVILDEVEVKAINGSAKDALDYVDAIEPKRIIAIGGDKLARGLTLEGLVTSYFLRASKMYDTLMQMGRWFGYRDGYIDLCRLYTTGDLIEWFEHITDAAEELRSEFDYMEQTGSSPREYGLKVKSHPTLLVTSPLKMRNGRKMQLSYSGDVVETVAFSTDLGIVTKNMTALNQLVRDAGLGYKAPSVNSEVSWNGYRWDSISSELIIDFLDAYTPHEKSYKVNTELLRRFIQEMNRFDELKHWNVAIINGSHDQPERIGEHNIYPVQRSARNSGVGRFSIGRLLSPKDEAIDLTLDEWSCVVELSASASSPSGPAIRSTKAIYRGKPAQGLLLIYLVRPRPPVEPDQQMETPFVGLGLSFPSSSAGAKVTYIVNAVGQNEHI